jgi:hypothetical protein
MFKNNLAADESPSGYDKEIPKEGCEGENSSTIHRMTTHTPREPLEGLQQLQRVNFLWSGKILW